MIDRIRYMTVRKTYYHRKSFYQNQFFKIILAHAYQQMQHIPMSDKKATARIMYVVEGNTRKQIALAVGVTERTVFTWIHQHAWKKLKTATLQAPVTILENPFRNSPKNHLIPIITHKNCNALKINKLQF